ncbi:glycoside hydrolase family 75 protein [Chaetomium strumarium]|uniref:Endo-chitosanase n=1 Tax=Chaetomium strumarium TaxID=1170767 RepID=A0AAJ0M379_9PEZI|nr:glycoside hydrolase family 75 protein [Chaetomium strumarium]
MYGSSHLFALSSALLPSALLPALLDTAGVSAREVPANIQCLYDALRANGTCRHQLATGFFAKDDGPSTFFYCGDHLADFGYVYLKGPDSALADMDVDCDGVQHGPGDDGRCASSNDTQAETSFQGIVAGYNKGITDLNPFVHPYVVFGNRGSKPGWPTFDPREYGIEPHAVVPVVCNNQLHFAVWGDENGDDGDKPMIGEASISLATLCFGDSVNGNSGHDGADVLYMPFAGPDAVPGPDGADWAATTPQAFEASLEAIGTRLLQRIP